MTTPLALITRALKKAGVNGVGQSPSATDLQDALDDLNDMTAAWANERWLVPHLVELTFGPSGKDHYTIGPDITADVYLPTERPDRIESAFARYSPTSRMPIDYPMDILDSREDYNAIALKQYATVPYSLYYEPAFPLGNLFIWPNQGATGAANVHLFIKGPDLAKAWALNDTILLPQAFNDALLYGLACRLRPSYQLPPDATITALAVAALNKIRQSNTQVARSRMPDGLPGLRRGSDRQALMAGGANTSPAVFTLDVSLLDGSDALE